MSQNLVTVQEYRDITHDHTTSASAVDEFLDEAVDMLEGDGGLGRYLRHGTYTETLEVWYDDGLTYVYPLATPITDVPASANYVVDVGARRLRGVLADALAFDAVMVGVGYPEVATFFGDSSNRPAYSTVTYDGGYTHATVPRQLQRAIARLANGLITMSPQRASFLGAEAISVGDVSVKYPAAAGSLDEIVPGLSLTLRGFKRRRVLY